MKVEVVKRYADRYTKAIHEVGDIIEISKERYSDLRRFVKEIAVETIEIEEVKKAKKK